jgi:hypothetical protein
MGKAKTQPETQMSVLSSQRENSRPPNYPQLQSRCSRAVLEGTTQVNPDFATYLIPCESFISMILQRYLIKTQDNAIATTLGYGIRKKGITR